ALQIASTRCASSRVAARRLPSGADMARGLLARDAPERGADRHADPGEIALAEDVAGHDLARGPDVLGEPAVLHAHAGLVVDADAEVGEGDAGAQRPRVVRRRVDAARPMGLRRRDSLRAAIVE